MKKKILYIHHGTAAGGAPRSLSFLIKSLDKEKYEPIVLCCYDGGCKELFSEAGATVIIGKHMAPFHGSIVSGMNKSIVKSNIIHVFSTYFYTLKILKKIRPDIVHLNSTCLFVCAKAVKNFDTKIPVVTHIREPLLSGFWGNILRKENRKYTDAFVSIDEFDANTVNTEGKKLDIIYNFVDLQEYHPDRKSNVLRRELKLKKEDVIFLYAARIAESNGALELLQMISDIKNKNFHFVLIGAPESNTNDYEVMVEKLANEIPNVHLLKFRNDIIDCIADSDVLVCPFTKPHFARGIIEAAALGKPTIATNIGGPQELVEDGKTGFLYNMNDKSIFIKYCEELGTNEKIRSEMGMNARKYAELNFDAKANAQRTFAVYQELLENVY
ncbi:MAG: glycosyltransferase family 4 protein [Lachnospiraceae bacterium]|nr:glycosyltransferase family 4 protein [Lachnospiraceae bacterium]